MIYTILLNDLKFNCTFYMFKQSYEFLIVRCAQAVGMRANTKIHTEKMFIGYD